MSITETKKPTKSGLGSKRSVQQVWDTVIFEFQRNLKRALILLAVMVAIYIKFW